ncbi:hypothetical protein WJX84_001931 [Apatococcus fuscideae]|uniref:PPIase cyclophilin-type domain-containing protein n=1 Tax=Apatococcus fuscideae TaxID=2026836 RepID=A0AAW1T7B7_9CHLO
MAAEETAFKLPGAQRPGGRKRRVAVFIAYVGEGYQGMQINPGVKTIEDDLERAIHAAGGISDDNAHNFSKIHWARAARTDKGVSAVGNVVSLAMMVEIPDLVARINAHLPPQIRVLGFTRVTGTFDARQLCDKRRYEYILPASAFDPQAHKPRADLPLPGPPSAAAQACGAMPTDAKAAVAETGIKEAAISGAEAADEAGAPAAEVAADVQPADGSGASSGFVFDEAAQERLSNILADYQGTHNFHNFTVRMSPTDPSAKRYILNFSCAGVQMIEGKQWVRMVVLGQSFMMHQIRKMIGLAVAVARGAAPREAIGMALSPHRVFPVPMAPELGLFLDQTFFDAYNNRWGDDRDGKLTLDDYKQEVLDFKAQHMYPHISRKDAEAGINSSWVRTLNERCFHFSCWADPDALAAQLSAPRQLQASSSTMHSTDSWQRDPHFCPEQHAADLMKDGPSSGQGGWSDRGRGARSSARGGRASDRGGRQSDRGGRGRGSPRGGQSSWAGQKRDRNTQASEMKLTKERIIFQTTHGDIEMALYPEAAPKTVKHIMQLARLGAYNTNHFFRVDKGFVAQVADCSGGREAPLDPRQAEEEAIRVPLEVSPTLKHTRRGILSMARHSDPNSGGSSFSIILNPTPHLDMEYTIFGEVTNGLEALASMETVSTRSEGIFVMPETRINILSSYVHIPPSAGATSLMRCAHGGFPGEGLPCPVSIMLALQSAKCLWTSAACLCRWQ